MDIYECFKFFNQFKNSFPLLYDLEAESLETNRAKTSFMQRVFYRIIFLLFFYFEAILLYSACVTFTNDQQAITNVLGLMIFLDNYGPIMPHIGLLVVTRRPVPMLVTINRIDELLIRSYCISIDYRRRRRTFLGHVVLFEGGFLFMMVFFVMDYVVSNAKWYNSTVMVYFIIIWVVFILQLVMYCTIILIIRDKVQVIRNNVRLISEDHRILFAKLLYASVESTNLIGSGIIGLFVGFSTFYITLDIYVLYRFRAIYLDRDLYTIGSGIFMIFLIFFNVYLVTPACYLKKELEDLNETIGLINEERLGGCNAKLVS